MCFTSRNVNIAVFYLVNIIHVSCVLLNLPLVASIVASNPAKTGSPLNCTVYCLSLPLDSSFHTLVGVN